MSHQTGVFDPNDLKVSQWLKTWDGREEIDAAVIGVPLSRSSISASAASEAPLAVRQSWRSFSTYDVDHDVDLAPLRVRDLGDICMHTTDILQCHENIEKAVEEVYQEIDSPLFVPLILGGDHSITCPSIKAFSKVHRNQKIGLLQFDTHFDVRELKGGGPSNGTPIRGLIEAGVLQGEHIFQIGIHGFSNSLPYRKYVEKQGITFFTMPQVRKQGLNSVLCHVLNKLHGLVDMIYVTVDMDVLDLSFFPGSPGSSPGGMVSWELFEAVYQLGMQKKVRAIDFVCFDPFRDVGMVSVKTVTHTMLSFLAGYQRRLTDLES